MTNDSRVSLITVFNKVLLSDFYLGIVLSGHGAANPVQYPIGGIFLEMRGNLFPIAIGDKRCQFILNMFLHDQLSR